MDHRILALASYRGIAVRRREVLREIRLDPFMESLEDYYVADELSDLIESHVIRWFNLNTENLTSGGILVGVQMFEDGAHLRVKQVMRFGGAPRFWDVKFNEVVVFQRLTQDERLILEARDL
jgi:hypothetical protein